MAFDPAIDIGVQTVEFASGPCVSELSKMFYGPTLDLGNACIDVDFSTGGFVSEAAKVFRSPTLDLGAMLPLVDFTSGSYVVPPQSVFRTGTAIIYVSALPVLPGDQAIVIVFGLSVDFSAFPRRGRAPLTVLFTNLCGGTFDRFEWDFGDGKTSIYSGPTHVYEDPGIYDVTLRARIDGRWYEHTKRRYIFVYPGGLIVSYTNRSFTLAILPSQGIGFSENTGEWPMPEAGAGPVYFHDDDNQPHLIVQDANDGYEYDILQRDGPESTGIEKSWKDKVSVEGTGGTAVAPLLKFVADVGTFEHYWIRHCISHIYARSANEDKYRGASGYDAAGFPSGIQFLLKFFVDGERVTAERQIKNIPVTGDLTTDEHVEGHRLQLELSANMGAHAIVGRKSEYVVTDKMDGTGVMTEDDYQEEFAIPLQWFSRGPYNKYIFTDRATGTELDGDEQDKFTRCQGPDGEIESAVQFDEAVTFPAVTLMGVGTLLIWHQSLASVTIGGTPIVLTQYGIIGSWIFSYAKNIAAEGELVITPDGTGKIFEHRIFFGQITDEAIEYYFNNINDHNGDVMLPWD